jgi:hypothetical protein
MSTGGWVFMLVSWGVIIGFLAYTLWRTLGHKESRQK